MYGCKSWTIKRAERRRIDAFELWCWRRLLRVPWIARRSNQSILKENSPGCSLEGLMLKLKLQYTYSNTPYTYCLLSHTFSGHLVLFATYGSKLHLSVYQTLLPPSFHVAGHQQLLGRQERKKAGVSHPFSSHPPASLPGIQSFLVSWPTPMPPAAPGVGIFRWLHTVSLVCRCHLFHHLQTQFSVESSLFTMLSPVILTCHHT